MSSTQQKTKLHTNLEHKLQLLLIDAAAIDARRSTSQTSCKREYYTKKFNKTKLQILKYTNALDVLSSLIPAEENIDAIDQYHKLG